MLRIRLARRGRKKRPSYRVVVMPSRAARDGRYVDDLGYYNPLSDPSDIQIDLERARKWVRHGAQPSDRVWKLLEVLEPGFRDGIRAGGTNSDGAGAVVSTAAVETPKSEAKSDATAKAKTKAKAKAKSKSKAKSSRKTKAK